MDIDKLKVAELRSELQKHGLDTKGTKPILVARLKEFLSGSINHEEDKTSIVGGSADVIDEPKEADEEEDAKGPNPMAPSTPTSKPDDNEAEQKMVTNDIIPDTEDKAVPVSSVSAEGDCKPQDEEAKATPQEPQTAQEEPQKAQEEPLQAQEQQQQAQQEPQQVQQEPQQQQRRGQKRKRYEEEHFSVVEDEPEIDKDLVCLDWFNSDLSLRICKNTFMSAEPLFKDGWGYVWSGCRITHGVISGKVGFEVKLLEKLDARVDDKNLHELRVGWSADDSDMLLGESAMSFCYCGSAKKAKNSDFQDYGAEFSKDDVVGAFIDMDADPVVVTFTKNGVSQGTAFEIPKNEFHNKAIFPHISTRNIKFEVNLGKTKDKGTKEPWFPLLENYVSVAHASNMVQGSSRIASREDCEMIMMVGLPGCGKTTWVNKHVLEHPDKKYNVIGTSALLDKMKVNGQPRKKGSQENWAVLIQKSTRCLQECLRLASQRRRNYIIDQTNVYANAQRRKIRPFQGMIRKAVVIVPSDEDYKARIEAQEKAESKDVPDTALMEMKANFSLPTMTLSGVESGSESAKDADTQDNSLKDKDDSESDDKQPTQPLFSDIFYVELKEEEARKLVEQYNKDAKDKGYGKRQETQRKRPRGNLRLNRRPGPGIRGHIRNPFPGRFPRGGGPFRGMPPRGFRGGMPPMRGGMPPMRPAPFRDFRDNRNRGGSAFGRGGFGGGPGMGGGGGGGNANGHRFNRTGINNSTGVVGGHRSGNGGPGNAGHNRFGGGVPKFGVGGPNQPPGLHGWGQNNWHHQPPPPPPPRAAGGNWNPWNNQMGMQQSNAPFGSNNWHHNTSRQHGSGAGHMGGYGGAWNNSGNAGAGSSGYQGNQSWGGFGR